MRKFLASRRGYTLIELLLFLGLFAVALGAIITLLSSSMEQRVRQQSVAIVEQNGIRILRSLTNTIRQGERILDPLPGESGSILALQMANEAINPVILSLESGALIMAQRDRISIVDVSERSNIIATISDFSVRNTSSSMSRPSLLLGFTVSRVIPLPQKPVYSRRFEALITLFPDDQLHWNGCNCAAPSCTDGRYRWEICENETCQGTSVSVACE